AAVEGGVHRARWEQSRHRDSLVDRHIGPDLQHLATVMGNEPLPLRLAGDLVRQRLRRALVGRAPPMERDDRALVLDPDPGALEPSTSVRTAERSGRWRSGAVRRSRALSELGAATDALVSPAMPTGSRTLKLAVIGTAAGVLSGLLGVGGGSVIVPLLIVWL